MKVKDTPTSLSKDPLEKNMSTITKRHLQIHRERFREENNGTIDR